MSRSPHSSPVCPLSPKPSLSNRDRSNTVSSPAKESLGNSQNKSAQSQNSALTTLADEGKQAPQKQAARQCAHCHVRDAIKGGQHGRMCSMECRREHQEKNGKAIVAMSKEETSAKAVLKRKEKEATAKAKEAQEEEQERQEQERQACPKRIELETAYRLANEETKRQQAIKLTKPGKHIKYSPQEDAYLLHLISQCDGPDRIPWKALSNSFSGRTRKHLHTRYTNHLNPSINKDDLTTEETESIEKQRDSGSGWAEIAKQMPGYTIDRFRTANQCKNWYNLKLSREKNKKRKAENSLNKKSGKK